MRVAAEQEEGEERGEWLRTAFLGYQLTMPYRKSPLSFEQYLHQVGLTPSPVSGPEAPDEDLATVKERALAAADRIRQRDTARHSR